MTETDPAQGEPSGPTLLTGTSGFSYKAWRGGFYPEDLSDKDMLAHYAGRLATVEINNTFYRMPRASMLEGWRDKVPDAFVFVIKAPQRITHRARLKDAEDSVAFLWETLQALGPKLGPVLFQLPPNFRCDLERLGAFLSMLPEGLRAAFEFRHPSWYEDDTLEVLREHDAVWVAADVDSDAGDEEESSAGEVPELPVSADWGYLRLRRETYTEDDLAAWAAKIAAQPWRRAFVFFKHDGEEAWSARRALRLAQLAQGG